MAQKKEMLRYSEKNNLINTRLSELKEELELLINGLSDESKKELEKIMIGGDVSCRSFEDYMQETPEAYISELQKYFKDYGNTNKKINKIIHQNRKTILSTSSETHLLI